MVIHFFRNRSEERIDFFELIDNYFSLIENCNITTTEEQVELKFTYPHFNFSYQYLITKRTRVSSMYKLNSQFVNINLLVEIPPVLPQYIIKIILIQMDDLCSKFHLAIYHDGIDNITSFNMYEMFTSLVKERDNYLTNNLDVVKYYVPADKLNQIFGYQSKIDELPKILNEDVVAAPYLPLLDLNDKSSIQFSINYRVGLPFIFPQHLSYIHIEEEENLISLISASIFFKFTEKLMYEIKDTTCDIKLRYVNEKNSLKIKKLLRKMRKYMIASSNFASIEMTDLIEERGKIDEN